MKTFFKALMWGLFGVVFFSLCTGAYFWYVWSSNLPYIGLVKEYRPSTRE